MTRRHLTLALAVKRHNSARNIYFLENRVPMSPTTGAAVVPVMRVIDRREIYGSNWMTTITVGSKE